MVKILHVLSQRPSRTGSGITLDAIVRLGEQSGWLQAVVVGIPASDQNVVVGALNSENIHCVRFEDKNTSGDTTDLNFPVPGMSDVMPYPSTVWSTLDSRQLKAYREVWARRLEDVVRKFKPDLIHSNHIWLVSSMLKDIAPNLPILTTCHATGLRQLDLCPHLASEVIAGCRRNDHFFVLRRDHASFLSKTLNIPPDRISLAGVGFRDELFTTKGHNQNTNRQDLLYVGKFSAAKGLPWLLDAFEILRTRKPNLILNIAGDGSGPEAEALRARMQAMTPAVVMHGMLDQEKLAQLMRRCNVCVLPSFYEGVPLVLVEAAACGCRLVSTALPGVTEQIAPVLGPNLELIPLPRLKNVDQPFSDDLPRFTKDLVSALDTVLNSSKTITPDLDSFTWNAVFRRVESTWKSFTARIFTDKPYSTFTPNSR